MQPEYKLSEKLTSNENPFGLVLVLRLLHRKKGSLSVTDTVNTAFKTDIKVRLKKRKCRLNLSLKIYKIN